MQYPVKTGPVTNDQAAFGPEMVQGERPQTPADRRQWFRNANRGGWSSSQLTHVQATYIPAMGQGSRPDRFRERLQLRSGKSWWPPDIEAFDIAQVKGSRPDQPRLFLSRSHKLEARKPAEVLDCVPFPNILEFTEQFNNDYWTFSGTATVTPDTVAPPAAYSGGGLADLVEDNSAAAVQSIISLNEGIANDSTNWIASIFVLKDAVTTRFPRFVLQMSNGSAPLSGVSFNASTGAIVEGGDTFPATAAKGVVDVDASWWRIWWRIPNDSSGNTQARMFISPAYSSVIGDPADATVTGSVVVWGANLTNSDALCPYDPNPAYMAAFQGSWPDANRELFPARVGWSSSQFSHVAAAFSPEMGQGSRPDRFREFLPLRTGYRVAPDATNTAAAISIEMMAGAHPDRFREWLPLRTGRTWWPPDISPVDAEQVRGFHPDRPQLWLPLRLPQPVSQVTHVAAPFTSSMSAGWHPDVKANLDLRTNTGRFTQAIDIPAFSIEMIRGWHPDASRAFTAPRIPLPQSQPTHVQAPITIDMLKGSPGERLRERLMLRTGIVAKAPDDQPFDVASVQGWHPDMARLFLAKRIRLPWGPHTTHVSAPITIDMLLGSHPDRQARLDQRLRVGMIAATPEIPAFSIEMIRGSRPDLPRLFLAPKIPLPVSQLTHVAAAFTPSMSQGVPGARSREYLPPRSLYAIPPPDVPPFSIEMVRGWMPESPRIFLAPRLMLTPQELTHDEAEFTSSMVSGYQPPLPRFFLHPKTAWMPATFYDSAFPGIMVLPLGEIIDVDGSIRTLVLMDGGIRGLVLIEGSIRRIVDVDGER